MIVLASNSASRRAMLAAAGVAFESRPAAIDERAIEAAMAGRAPREIAQALAREKALTVATATEPRWVLGSDSLVVVDGRRFDKPGSRAEAAAHLQFFSGRQMHLHSAAALARDGDVALEFIDRAVLRVRSLSARFIEDYLDAEWPAVAGCVGVFRIEATGIQLFDEIEGCHFTVLGMPLLPVLGGLRAVGELPA